MPALRPKSSFQELMELVSVHLEHSSDEQILVTLGKLRDLRQEIKQDEDLLETVIQRLEAVLRSRR